MTQRPSKTVKNKIKKEADDKQINSTKETVDEQKKAKKDLEKKPIVIKQETEESPNKIKKETEEKPKKIKKERKKITKKKSIDSSNNHLITDYYKVTRRKTSQSLKDEEEKLISYFLKNDIDDLGSLKIQEFEEKGKGIVTLRNFKKGAFICEYRGDLIDLKTAKERENLYESKKLGCYMYYFSWKNKQWCIDATADTGRLGRLINHSRKKPNLKTKLFITNNTPHLIFVALNDIEKDSELLYDYGETNRCVMESHPWIKNT